ncbi:MAG: hypothetical protein ACKV2T_01400 [Kofleriaceae bacterium]
MSDTVLRGWERTMSGDGVVFRHPRGTIRIRPALVPLQSFAAIMRANIPAGGDVQGPIAMVNAEGEYGAMVNAISGDEQFTLVVLFAETSYSLIIGHTADKEAHRLFVETVRRTAYGNSLGLGSDRRRPYLYERPAGWSGVRRAFSTLWIPDDAARTRASIEVFHARPARNSVTSLQYRRVYEQLPREFGEERPSEPVSAENRHGIQSQLVTFSGVVGGEPTKVTDAALADGRMLYLVRLSSRAAPHDTYFPVLQQIARSVRPLAAPKGDVDVLIDWFD